MDPSIRNEVLIREVLRNVCDRNEIVILSTAYMRFETTFLRLEESGFHCHANMGHEDAKFGLRSPDLKIRFPYGHHFYEGATRLLGLGRANGKQSLHLALPQALGDGDFRGAYRVERIGRVPVTFSTRKFDLLMGTLVNLSTSGIRLFLNRTYEDGELLIDDEIHVAFTLAETIRVNAKVKVRFVKDKIFGAQFRPPLSGELLDQLSRWAFKRREEDALALDARAASAGTDPAAARDQPAPVELVLVSSSGELLDQLVSQFAGQLPPLRRVTPTIQSLLDLGPGLKALVLFHVDSPSWVVRKRTRTLAESLPAGIPFVLIGTGVETQILFELGTELNAAWTYALPETPGTLFPRLLQGILRMHFQD